MDKLKLFRDVMYSMFKDGCLPDLDMEDYVVMWEALKSKWSIHIHNESWEQFIDEINVKASDRKEFFDKTFEKYF